MANFIKTKTAFFKRLFLFMTREALASHAYQTVRAGNYNSCSEGVAEVVVEGPAFSSQRHAHAIQPVPETSKPLYRLSSKLVGHHSTPAMIAEHPTDLTFGQPQELVEGEDPATQQPLDNVILEAEVKYMTRHGLLPWLFTLESATAIRQALLTRRLEERVVVQLVLAALVAENHILLLPPH